jgi:MFS family permease
LQRKSLNWIVTMSVVLWMVATVLIAVAEVTAFALVGALGAGMAWVGVFASLSAGAQSAAPAWVRARALAVNLVAVQASLALGSVIWGVVASAAGTRTALLAAAGTMALLHLANRRLRVEMGTEADVTPGLQLPEMTLASEPLPDDGPILIQIEYRVAADDRAHFLRAVHAVEKVRRRNGASSWRVFRDLGEDGRFVERFVVTSWGEYVRLRTRMTVSDRKLLAAIEALQKPGVPLGVSRFIGIDPDDVAHRA